MRSRSEAIDFVVPTDRVIEAPNQSRRYALQILGKCSRFVLLTSKV